MFLKPIFETQSLRSVSSGNWNCHDKNNNKCISLYKTEATETKDRKENLFISLAIWKAHLVSVAQYSSEMCKLGSQGLSWHFLGSLSAGENTLHYTSWKYT